MRAVGFSPVRPDADELFERFFGGGASTAVRGTGFEVPTDVFHTEDALIVRLDLPGVDPDKVEVTVQENTLFINGSRPFPYESDNIRFVRRGTFYGDFTQRVVLGKGLDLDKVNAHYSDGVLELRIPYSEEVQPRKIAIELGNGKPQLTE